MENTLLVPVLLLLISVGIGILIRQSTRQADKTDAVKDAVGEQKVTIGRLDEKFCNIESRVDDLHKRRNIEQERAFSLAADAIIELRDEHRRRRGDTQ